MTIPTGRVLAYLRDREAWERRAYVDHEAAIADGTLSAMLDRIDKERQAILTRHLTREALAGAPSSTFGDPPSAQAGRAVILSSKPSSNVIAIVRTREWSPSPGGKEDFEYELHEGPDGWRIADRRTRDDRGRWIRYLV